MDYTEPTDEVPARALKIRRLEDKQQEEAGQKRPEHTLDHTSGHEVPYSAPPTGVVNGHSALEGSAAAPAAGDSMTIHLDLGDGALTGRNRTSYYRLCVPNECTVASAKRAVCRAFCPTLSPGFVRLAKPETGEVLQEHQDPGDGDRRGGASGAAQPQRLGEERTLQSYGVHEGSVLLLGIVEADDYGVPRAPPGPPGGPSAAAPSTQHNGTAAKAASHPAAVRPQAAVDPQQLSPRGGQKAGASTSQTERAALLAAEGGGGAAVSPSAAAIGDDGDAALSLPSSSGQVVDKRKAWTREETFALLDGMRKYESGAWRAILRDPEFAETLKYRTDVNLKDRWVNLARAAERNFGNMKGEFRSDEEFHEKVKATLAAVRRAAAPG